MYFVGMEMSEGMCLTKAAIYWGYLPNPNQPVQLAGQVTCASLHRLVRQLQTAEHNVSWVCSASDTASSADSIAILPADVEICQHPDGRPWVLGAGNFGKVGVSQISCTWALRHLAIV